MRSRTKKFYQRSSQRKCNTSSQCPSHIVSHAVNQLRALQWHFSNEHSEAIHFGRMSHELCPHWSCSSSTVNRWARNGDGNEIKGSKEVHLQLFGWHSARTFSCSDHNVLNGTSEEVRHQMFRRCWQLGLQQRSTCTAVWTEQSTRLLLLPLSWTSPRLSAKLKF